MSVTERIPTMTDQELLTLFGNATIKLVQSKGPTEADIVLSAIETEWKARLDCVPAIPDRTGSPTVGMPAALGYRVGATNGETTAARRRILKHILERALPFVHSREYTMQWGSPSSSKRLSKLTQFLQSQIANPAHSEHSQAVIEWSEDLDWVQQNYKHLSAQ